MLDGFDHPLTKGRPWAGMLLQASSRPERLKQGASRSPLNIACFKTAAGAYPLNIAYLKIGALPVIECLFEKSGGHLHSRRELRECNAGRMSQAIKPVAAMPSSKTPRMMR
ncbi:hypothetical protein M2311_001084 [Rhizobium leguminosarum]|uniref:hypothetical protein n=1 Tax=Rhizobium leguminosarum TaxID=384 RepID=UPI002474491E|nr:hypothetical protein [Rhizobium leguminosarum]MDH6271019.1 hypothetical protein [Rhizobium leguminosarum]